MRRNRLTATVLVTTCLLAAAACSSSDGGSEVAGPQSTADPGQASAVTPVGNDVLAAAKEEGSLLLYTNADEQLMAPLVEGFEAAYPDIKVRSLDLSDAQIFQRYESEVATGTDSADLIISNDPIGVRAFVADGHVLDYTDPNVANLPDYAQLDTGVVALSEDPLIAVFNKALLPEDEQPTSMAELAEMAPDLKGKIGTTDISNPVQLVATSSYVDRNGEDGWAHLEAIGKSAGVESGTGNLAQKLLQGEYEASFFVSGALRALLTGDAAKVVNYAYLTDGTPLIPRAIAITAEAPSPNAAKVFLNYALSVEGQEEACKGGFTPYRSGVTCPFGLAAIQEAVGAENVIAGPWPDDLAETEPDTVARWNEAFGR